MRLGGILAGGALTAAACGVALIRAKLLIVTVQGESMRPTLREGDRVLVVRRSRMSRPRGGDLVVCHSPRVLAGASESNGLIVKRVVAVAGERIPWNADRSSEAVVPTGSVYIMGDATDYSNDSRDFGPVPWNRVLGTVIRRLPAQRPSAFHSPMPGDGTVLRSARPMP